MSKGLPHEDFYDFKTEFVYFESQAPSSIKKNHAF